MKCARKDLPGELDLCCNKLSENEEVCNLNSHARFPASHALEKLIHFALNKQALSGTQIGNEVDKGPQGTLDVLLLLD